MMDYHGNLELDYCQMWIDERHDEFVDGAEKFLGEHPCSKLLITAMAGAIVEEYVEDLEKVDGMSFENAVCYLSHKLPYAFRKDQAKVLYDKYFNSQEYDCVD